MMYCAICWERVKPKIMLYSPLGSLQSTQVLRAIKTEAEVLMTGFLVTNNPISPSKNKVIIANDQTSGWEMRLHLEEVY